VGTERAQMKLTNDVMIKFCLLSASVAMILKLWWSYPAGLTGFDRVLIFGVFFYI
jgi:hypothetical protein